MGQLDYVYLLHARFEQQARITSDEVVLYDEIAVRLRKESQEVALLALSDPSSIHGQKQINRHQSICR
jgi:hypothetical protein